jgi:hypothetical protein
MTSRSCLCAARRCPPGPVSESVSTRPKPALRRYRQNAVKYLGGWSIANCHRMSGLQRPCRDHGTLFSPEHRRPRQSCRAALRRRPPLPNGGRQAISAGTRTASRTTDPHQGSHLPALHTLPEEPGRVLGQPHQQQGGSPAMVPVLLSGAGPGPLRRDPVWRLEGSAWAPRLAPPISLAPLIFSKHKRQLWSSLPPPPWQPGSDR